MRTREFKKLSILELLEQWWKEIEKVYGEGDCLVDKTPVIRVFDRDRRRIVAIDEELTKKLEVPQFIKDGGNLHKPFHRSMIAGFHLKREGE